MAKNKIEHEKRIVAQMILLYCKHKLGCKELPQEYADLTVYCHRRLDNCRWKDRKPSCKRCPIHCYAPHKREQIRRIMRWAGPRMVLYMPMEFLRHVFHKAPTPSE
ncbi:MAG TPA: nitrous oxide-stimulated promoter family protein [Prevotella sp.]